MRTTQKRVGLVATGDELINGDIHNTNGQHVTRTFIEQGICPGRQVVVRDDEQEIEQAIRYLLADHSAVITIGGLGPTSDDKTRFGLAKAINSELRFDETAWRWLTNRLNNKGITIPETNRQQALFPVDSTPVQNFNGTAAACYLNHAGKDIFMLPGPPNECLPIFDDFVLQKLIERHYATETLRRSWLLLSVSESKIAAELEPLAEKFPHCQLGYRVSYPYLEVKLLSSDRSALTTLSQQFDQQLGAKLISRQRQTASEQLRHLLETGSIRLHVHDQATHGAFEACLSTPKTLKNLSFSDALQQPCYQIALSGLDHYWSNGASTLQLSIDEKTTELSIPLRGRSTLTNAIECCSCQIVTHYRLQQTAF